MVSRLELWEFGKARLAGMISRGAGRERNCSQVVRLLSLKETRSVSLDIDTARFDWLELNLYQWMFSQGKKYSKLFIELKYR